MLKEIKNRTDILNLSAEQDKMLAAEIRDFLVQHVAQTGGHLASNLGVVELTIAMQKVYDTEIDRIVFDVGHQAYVHKMLTGRMEQFESLRTYGGLAGFPKPTESRHDAFVAGHASNAVSVALGMARARTMNKEEYSVVAILGDGALSGGLAYEGLNDAGASGEPIVVILNDNAMSINRNVGAMAKHLSMVRLKPGYIGLKRSYRNITNKIPGGKAFYKFTSKLKNKLRRKLLGVTIFEEMGFQYLGPVDGHNVRKLTFLLNQAKEMNEPVLLHVITKKGKGYEPAEDMPATFHGIGKFDPDTGVSNRSHTISFSDTFGETMCELADKDEKLCAITAAMETGTGLSDFAKRFPNRFYDVGIAEGHAVSMAAGLAKQGMTPVFAVYSTFLQRSFDMLVHDVSLLGLHVVLAVDRAGLVGEDGETHHGVFDVGYLRQIPGMKVLCPASQAELKRMLHDAVMQINGPVAVRYPKGGDGVYRASEWKNQISVDSKLTIVTYGTTINEAMEASKRLRSEEVVVDLIKLDQIVPINYSDVVASVQKTKRIILVEETADAGCIGRIVASELLSLGLCPKMKLLNLGSGIVTHGDLKTLKAVTGIDADGIYKKAKELLHEE